MLHIKDITSKYEDKPLFLSMHNICVWQYFYEVYILWCLKNVKHIHWKIIIDIWQVFLSSDTLA